jgi:2-polyprenyl-3-methyl-5-hydroxy-6-metoxy-1,4-benzoquinol methylase
MKLTTVDDLESKALRSRYAEGINTQIVHHAFKIFKRHITGQTLLELGPAEGVMTDLLVTLGKKITIVEGAASFCDDLRQRHPTLAVHHSLFEEFQPQEQFDTIIMGQVLEHLDSPVTLLRCAREWLAPNGVLLATVPNSRSLHRQAAVLMGLLSFEEELNETDRHHGHKRVYNPETFRRDFLQAGYQIDLFGGFFIKPLSNTQIEQTWTSAMIDSFLQLGERYPDISAALYIVARHKDPPVAGLVPPRP